MGYKYRLRILAPMAIEDAGSLANSTHEIPNRILAPRGQAYTLVLILDIDLSNSLFYRKTSWYIEHPQQVFKGLVLGGLDQAIRGSHAIENLF